MCLKEGVWDGDTPNVYNMPVWACYMCSVEGRRAFGTKETYLGGGDIGKVLNTKRAQYLFSASGGCMVASKDWRGWSRDGRGWVGMVFGGAGGQYVGSLA